MDSGIFQPARFGFVIGAVVFLLVGATWQGGYFQRHELGVYDHFIRWRSDPRASDPRLLLILQSEEDIDQLDYPLRDKVLAALLERIESGNPAAIGVDLYRDLPEPRDRSGSAVLDQVLQRYPNIICIFKFGTEDHPFQVPPPRVLMQDETRYGFNDFPYDFKTVRRGFISLPSTNRYDSFAWKLAQLYLGRLQVYPAAEGNDIRLGKAIIRRFHSSDGGYVDVKDTGYQFFLDFRGPLNFETETLSIQDVRELDQPGVFKDKIVLIGSSAETANDSVTTPMKSQEPGVFLHAQIINQLLRAALNGDPPPSAFGWAKWPWMALWGFCGVISGLSLRSSIVSILSFVLPLGLIVLLAWLFFLGGYWVPVVGPAALFFLTVVAVKFYAARHEGQQRTNLMKLFSQHVSPEIVSEIWTQRDLFLRGGRPSAQRMVVTVLFTDLKDYSTISEKMSPNDLIAWVNECQGALARQVHGNSGLVNCYMGDGMMAIFGIPTARTNETEMRCDAINAVQCALSMAAEIRQMNARWREQGRPLASLRVGIFTGEVMYGVLGSDDHLAYSVIGDTVNTASRLESVDKEDAFAGAGVDARILIGELTYRYIKDRFPALPVGKIGLKGKRETTAIYKVIDHPNAAGSAPVTDFPAEQA